MKPNTTIEPQEELTPEEQWDDTKFRHAYFEHQHTVAMCGYTGPSTWKNEPTMPPNICPICASILPEYWDGKRWIKKP